MHGGGLNRSACPSVLVFGSRRIGCVGCGVVVTGGSDVGVGVALGATVNGGRVGGIGGGAVGVGVFVGAGVAVCVAVGCGLAVLVGLGVGVLQSGWTVPCALNHAAQSADVQAAAGDPARPMAETASTMTARVLITSSSLRP